MFESVVMEDREERSLHFRMPRREATAPLSSTEHEGRRVRGAEGPIIITQRVFFPPLTHKPPTAAVAETVGDT